MPRKKLTESEGLDQATSQEQTGLTEENMDVGMNIPHPAAHLPEHRVHAPPGCLRFRPVEVALKNRLELLCPEAAQLPQRRHDVLLLDR